MKPPIIRPLSRLFVAIATVTALSPCAFGSTWTTGAGDGTGNWATGANWGGTAPVTGATLAFGATTGTTTLTDNLMTPGTFTVAGITFSAGAASYTINAGTVGGNPSGFTLTGGITNSGTALETINDNIATTASRTITMTAAGGNLTLGGNISGVGGQLSTGGTGTLTLNGNNTFTGVSSAVGGNPAINVGLNINANDTVVLGSNTAAGTGAIEFSGGSGILTAAAGGITIANGMVTNNNNATIGAGGNLTVNGLLQFGGSNTITVNNNTTFAGGVDIRDSTASTRNAVFAGSGNILINSTIANGFAGSTGSLIYQGTGTLTLSGNNTFTGSVTLSQGTLGIGSNAPSGASGALGVSTGVISVGNTGTAATPGAAILTTAPVTVARGIQEQFASGTTPATDVQSSASLTIGTVSTGTSTFSGALQIASTNTLTAASGGEADFTGAITNYFGFPLVNLLITGGGTVKLTDGTANTFGGTGSTITVQNNTVLNLGSTATNTTSLGSATNVLVLNGGTLQFSSVYDPTAASRTVNIGASNGTIDTNGNAITVAGVLANSAGATGGLTLNDTAATPGSLTLAGANTYAGGTTITAGTLITGPSGTLGNTNGGLTVNGGGLNLNGTSQTVGALAGAGGSIYNNGASSVSTLTVGSGSSSTSTSTYSGVIKDNTGSGGQVALTKVGAGTITLNGANTYTGATSVTNGTLAIGAAGSLGGTSVTLGGTNGTLQVGALNSSQSATIGNNSSGSLTINSGGILTFANGVAGAVSSNVDTLFINDTTNGAAALTLNSGVINIGVGGMGGSDQIALTGATGLLASLTGSTTINLNVLTALNGSSQELIAWGAAPSSGGTFALGTVNGLGAGGFTLSLSSTSAGLFLIESAVSNAYWQGAHGSSWATGLPGGSSNFTTDAAGTTNRTTSLGSTTSVIFAATNASPSSYANTTLDGSPTVDSLTFQVSGVGISAGNSSSNAVTIASAGTGITVNSGLGTESISANVNISNTQTWMVNSGSTLAVSGNVGGTGTAGLNKAGTGTLALSGINTYSGATAVLAGAISAQSADALDGTSGVSVSSGAALQLANNTGFTTTNATALTLNGTGLSNGGALENVSGANTYTGAISLFSDSTIGVDSGSSLLLNSANITNANNNTLTLTGAGKGDLVSVLSGGALVKNGTGTWSVEGNNSYAGGTTINAGLLQLGTNSTALVNPNFLGSVNGALTVNTGGTLDLYGWNLSVGNLNGTGGTITNNYTIQPIQSILTLNTVSASSYAGSITDGASGIAVIKQGAATQTLTGTNSYTGTTSIQAGALNIASNGALGTTSNVTVSSGAALQLSGGITTPAAVPLTLTGFGTGTVTPTGTGALENVSGNNTFTGPITLAGDSSIGSDSGLLTLASTATIGGSGNLTLVGAGNGSITSVIGGGITSLTVNTSGTYTSSTNTTGTWTLTGANAYTGPTTVTNGTLAYNSAAAIPSSSAINLGGTAANTIADLTYTGAGETIADAINLNGSQIIGLGNSGTGRVTYNGTFTTGTGSKTLILGNPTDTIGGTINSNLTNGTGTLAVTKTGTINDRWILNGTNSYTGTTTINGGVLQVAAGTTFTNLNLNGTVSNAVLQTSGTLNLITSGTGTDFTWGPSGGFSAIGGTLTVTLNNGGLLSWGSNFSGNGGAVIDFGSSSSNAQVILTNNINLNTTDGFQQSIYVAKGAGGDSTLLSGIISGGTTLASAGPPAVAGSASGLTKAGAGTLILTNANNSYSGYTSIESGTLVAEASSTITATPTAGVAGYTATGVFGNGYGNYGAAAPVAGFSTIYVGTNQGGGTTLNGVTNPTLLIGSQAIGGSNSIANPIAIDWNNGTGQIFGIGGYTDANSTFSGAITLTNAAATGNTFAVTQVATTGTDALNITGGITSTNGGNINFANVGTVNVTTTPISNGGATAVSVTQTGAGTTTFAAANTYTGGTTVSGGNFQLTGSTSATGAFNVGGVTGGLATATLSGTGTVGGALTTSSANANVAHLAPGVNAAGSNVGGAGTLTIAGALNIGTGTNIDIDLSSSTTTGDDSIAMSGGTLTLGSSLTFNYNQLSGANTLSSSPYTLITGFTGTPTLPTSFTSTGINGYTAVYSIVGNSLDVTFTSATAPAGSAFYTGATSTDLATAANFATTAGGTTPVSTSIGSSTDIYLTANSASNTTPTLNANNVTVNSVTFTGAGTSAAAGVTLSGTKTLTIGGGSGSNAVGIAVQAGSGANTISAPVALGASQTWSNASSNLLTVSGGVTGTGNLALQDNSTGGITLSGGTINHTGSITNSGTGSGTTTISSVIGANVTSVTQNSATSTLVLSAANNYAGGTAVTAGKLFVNNTSGSATGSGAVSVTGSTSILKGNGIIGGAVTLSSGANLYSGSTAAGTGIGSGMTLTSALAVNGASLTFQLNNGSSTATYANPNETTSFLNLGTTGSISFTGTDSINLVDLTSGGLTLRANAPYLLISAASDSMFSGLVTVNAAGVLSLDGNGTVLGVWQGGALSNYTAITINELSADGVTSLADATVSDHGYYQPSLYLTNGDLEVVPEPGTWALMLGGLALLIIIQRRRSKLS